MRPYEKIYAPKPSINAICKKAVDSGILTFDDIMNSSKEKLMQTIVEAVHPYTINQYADGKFHTYVKDPRKLDNRRSICKRKKEDLLYFLLSFYRFWDVVEVPKTFGSLFKEWIEYKKKFVGAPNSRKSLSVSTIRRYERDYEKYIEDSELDSLYLDRVTSVKIEEFFLDLIQAHQCSERCINNLFGYIRQSFAFAERSFFIQNNPMTYVDKQMLLSRCPAPTKTDSDSDRILTKTQLSMLKEEVLRFQKSNPSYMPVYALELALYTGMRLGELAALQWSSIDDLFIHIDFSEHRLEYSNRKTEIVVGEPKNRKHRKIPLTKETRNLFRKIRAVSAGDEKGFVFTKRDGSRCTANAIASAVSKLASNIGIEHVSIHRIRRTVSSLLNESLPQKAVAELLGHTEKVNEMHYHYSTLDYQEKVTALANLSHQMEECPVISFG